MGLTTNGLPGMAASGNRTVAVVTTPEGGLVWTSWELGGGGAPWTSVPINGPIRLTDVAPAVSFRTTESGTSVWLAIKDSSDRQIYATLQQPDGSFEPWTLIPGVLTNVSPAVQFPMMIALAAPPDDSLYINVYLADQPTYPPPPGYWQFIKPSLLDLFNSLTTKAPAFTLVGDGSYMFVAISALDIEGVNNRLLVNQGNPYTPDQLVGWGYSNFDSNVSPAMAAANNRTVIVAVDPDGALFYDWWDLGGGSHGWVPLGNDVKTKVAPAISLVGNGNYMFVYAQGLDGELYINQANVGGSIIGWAPGE